MQKPNTYDIVQPSQTLLPDTTATTWRELIRSWWRATLAVLPIFLVTRWIFLLLTYFGGILFTVSNYSTESLTFREVIYQWYRWDAIRFISVATQGYTSQDYTAFFPLYPALEQLASTKLHLDILLAGMLISNLAFLGAAIVLYRLVETEFDKETARRTVLYLAIFPTAFFFFAAYNESLFLLFLLLNFYCLRRGHWWLSGFFGGLATLTRSVGILLMAIFVCEFLRQQWPALRQAWKEHARRDLAARGAGLLGILLIPLGLGIYALGLAKSFHDPLAFIRAQAQWRTGLSAPWVALAQSFKILASNSLYSFAGAHILIDLGALLLFALLLMLCIFGPMRFARDQWTFAFFGLLALLFAVSFPGIPSANGIYDPLPSMQRFVLEIFTGFIMLARLGKRQWFHTGYLLSALPLLAFLVLQFMTGHWTV